MSAADLVPEHVHDDELIILRISSCLHAYEYKVFLCHSCPGNTLFNEPHKAIKADSTWWAPESTLVIVGRQGNLIGISYKWNNVTEMDDLRTSLLHEVQFDREMLLAIHRTFANWRLAALIAFYAVIVAILIGVWVGKGHEGAGGAVTSMLVNLFAAYFHEIVRVQRH